MKQVNQYESIYTCSSPSDEANPRDDRMIKEMSIIVADLLTK